LLSGLKHIYVSGSGKVFHNMGVLNGMSPNNSPGTTLPIYQALLQGMVTTPLHNRSEDSVIVAYGMSSLHPSLKNVTTPEA
jgi:hypothetical protein